MRYPESLKDEENPELTCNTEEEEADEEEVWWFEVAVGLSCGAAGAFSEGVEEVFWGLSGKTKVDILWTAAIIKLEKYDIRQD